MLARWLPWALCALLILPTAAAEFGPESADGWPINVEGEILRPPVDPIPYPQIPQEILQAYADAHDHGHAHEDEGPLNKAGPLTVYPYYPLLTAELQRLASDHPDIVKLHSAGKSTAGLDLWLLEIADFARLEAGEGLPLDQREVVYIDGGTHSNEYSGVYFVTELAQFLLDEYESNETAKWVVENRHTWILPMVNPDGSHVFGRLNAKTVNINRNFPGTWGAVEEMPVLNNPGPEPASESETQTVIRLMDELKPDYVNSIHCCGNLWLHPWGAEQIPLAEDTEMFTRICDEVFADVREDCGPIWSTIYPASGTTADEGYARVGASSWTYEMSGRGRIAGPWAEPWTATSVREQEIESWAGVEHALLNVHKYGALPQLVSLRGSPTELIALVENAGWSNLTAGNLTIGDAAAPLPVLRPGESAEVRLHGTFEAGAPDATFDWKKRLSPVSPWEVRSVALSLVADNGKLVGVLGEGQAILPLDADVAAEVPAPSPVVLAALVAGIALASGAIRRGRT